MFRLILPVTICLAGPAQAQMIPVCLPGDCEQVLACIGPKGRWLNAGAFGAGPVNDIAGQMSDGVDCTGQQMLNNKVFSGSIALACTDGTRATLTYDQPLLDDERDHGWGHGYTKDGRDITIWVGQDLITTLRRESGGIVSLLPCPGGAVRLD